MRLKLLITFIFLTGCHSWGWCQSTDTLILKDIQADAVSPASQKELQIPSAGSLLQGVLYKANGAQKHPTLLILKGYPGNEKNIDLAQVVRARGWNVIYFDYRGSWGSQGQFSFANCVEDVVNVVTFCIKYADSLQVDTAAISLFGHSMGGWVCLKALQRLPSVKKGFALSTWDIYESFKDVQTTEKFNRRIDQEGRYFVLNTPPEQIFTAVMNNREFYANYRTMVPLWRPNRS